MADETELKGSIISINDPRLTQMVQKIDPEAEVGGRRWPTERDEAGNLIEYPVKFSLGPNSQAVAEATGIDRGLYFKESDKSGLYGVVTVQHGIVSGDFEGFEWRDWPTTIMFKGENSHRLANLMWKLGSPLPVEATLPEVKELVDATLGSEPIILCTLLQVGECSNHPRKKQWYGAKNYPKNGECPDCQAPVRWDVRIKDYLG